MCPCVTCFYPDQPCIPRCDEKYVPCPLVENDMIVQQPLDYTTLSANYANAATSFIRAKAGVNSQSKDIATLFVLLFS